MTAPTVHNAASLLTSSRAAYRAAYERWRAVRDDLAADVAPVWAAVDAAERDEASWRALTGEPGCVWTREWGDGKQCPAGGPSICDGCVAQRKEASDG